MRSNSHTDTLFHYTQKEDTLISILKDGFKFSYSKEDIIHDVFLAIPMISFCDIPLSISSEHSKKYGKYAIGLSKKNLIRDYPEYLNPVNYIIGNQQYKAAMQLHADYLECKDKWKCMIDEKQRNGELPVNCKFNGVEYNGVGLSDNMDIPYVFDLFNKINNKHRDAISMLGYIKKYITLYKGKEQNN